MAKRSSTADTTLLALEIFRRIPHHRKTTAPDLHKELMAIGLQRDLRTIQRQLDMLASHFSDIERDESSRPYGYRWKPLSSGQLAPQLNPKEALLLRLAELHLKRLMPVSVLESMKGMFETARERIDLHSGRELERQWLSKVRLVPDALQLLPPVIDPEIVAEVSGALYNNHWLSIDYTKPDGTSRQRDVMPLGLAQQGPRLYLVARDRNSREIRQFALHRMQKAKQTTERFERPTDFDLSQYEADGGFAFGRGERVRLSFEITKRYGQHLLETPLAKGQKVTDLGSHYRVSAVVPDTEHLTWWLRSFGDAVRRIRVTPLRQKKLI